MTLSFIDTHVPRLASSPSATRCRWPRARTGPPTSPRPASAQAPEGTPSWSRCGGDLGGQLLVYGAHKLWRRRPGRPRRRPDQRARLMELGRHPPATPGPGAGHDQNRDPGADRAPDLVKRHFVAERPNALWVTDLTLSAPGPHGHCLFHRRRLLPHDRRAGEPLPTCAPRWCSTPWRWPAGKAGHPPAGPSITTPTPAASSPACATGEAPRARRCPPSAYRGPYDNALAETVNGLYKTELVVAQTRARADRGRFRAGRSAAGCIWYSTERLHGYLGDVPPAEFEAAYAVQQTDQTLVQESNSRSLHRTQGASDPGVVGQSHEDAARPRRGPPSELRPLGHRYYPHTQRQGHPGYLERRLAEGRTKKEVIRVLKRYVAREVTATSLSLKPSR